MLIVRLKAESIRKNTDIDFAKPNVERGAYNTGLLSCLDTRSEIIGIISIRPIDDDRDSPLSRTYGQICIKLPLA